MFRAVISGALGSVSNAGELIYVIGLVMAVVGITAMCVVYVLRVMRYRLKGDQGKRLLED
jgi:hypothetical protein